MYSYAIAFLGGTLCLPLLAARLPDPVWACGLVATFVLSLVFKRKLAATFLLALAGFWLHSAWQLAASLPAALEGKDITLVGTVDDIPSRQGHILRFPLRVAEVADLPGSIAFPRRLRLSWYYPQAVPEVGERWRFKVRLRRPYGFRNPGGFDYEGWLFQQRIGATGYVRDQAAQRLAGPAVAQPHAWRRALYRHMHDHVLPLPGGEVIVALALGVRHGLSDSQWELYRITGTSHLMAISGLHIGLVAGLFFWLTRLLWARFPGLVQRLAAPRAAAVAAMAGAAGYAALAGFSIPTQRALIMVWLVCAGVALLRHVNPLNTLSLALVLVLLLDPLAVLSAGFWLSFTAVLLLVLFHRRTRAVPASVVRPRWQRAVQAQCLLSLGLMPLTLVNFHTLAWLSPVANLIAIPWVSLVVVPLTLAGLCLFPLSTEAAGAVWSLAGYSYVGLEWLLARLASSPMAELTLARPLWVAVAAMAGMVGMLLASGRRRILAALLVIPLPLYSVARPGAGEVWVDVLDVGQGLAVVAQTERHTLVYDTGPRFGSGLDTGEAVVMPFLRTRGVAAIDTLVVSHGDNDHIGGAASVLDAFPTGRVLTSRPEQLPVARVEACREAQGWHWDGVDFSLLHPGKRSWRQENNASCVLMIETASGQRLLLPGDIEASAEYDLVGRYRDALQAAVLLAPHHGSRSSSTASFITAVAPDSVIFPAGRHNRYGFPHPDILERYRQHNVARHTVGCTGALQVRLGGSEGPRLEAGHRLTAKRLWHWLDPDCAGAGSAGEE